MKRIAGILVGLGMLVAPALAHHASAAEYDISKTAIMQGKVTKVEWVNPHVRIYIDVTGADGNVVPWEVETGAPGGFTRNGYGKKDLKLGDTITVKVYPAKDGENAGDAVEITLSDGRKMLAQAADRIN